MAIDPNIILSLNQGVSRNFDPMTFFRAKEAAELSRGREEQNALALQKHEMDVAKQQRELEQEERFRGLLAQPGTGEERAERLISGGFPEQGLKLQKGYGEAANTQLDLRTKKVNAANSIIQRGLANPTTENMMALFDEAEAEYQIPMGKDRQLIASFNDDPKLINNYLVKRFSEIKEHQPKTEITDLGGHKVRRTYIPATNETISEERLEETATPGERLTAGTAAARLKFDEKKLIADTEAKGAPKPMTWQEEKFRRQVALEEEKKGLSAESKIRKFTDTMDSVDDLLGRQGDPEKGIAATPGRVNALTSGFGGMALSYVPGTPAFDVKESLKPILASLGFDELEAMREASKTGGALGQVAVKELGFLQGRVKSLEQAQSPKQLRDNLNTVRKHYQRWKDLVGSEKFKKEQAKQGGGAVPAGGGGYSDPDKEKRYQEYVRSRGG